MSSLRLISYTMPGAPLGKADPLPDLMHMDDPHSAIHVDLETVSPEESKYMGLGRAHTILPYKMQNGYSRGRRRKHYPAAVLENEHLRAVFLLSLGGRLWSLEDKDTGRELLHKNPVFQPANLALRNAWFSGGVEWNCGIIGHSPFTASHMCAEETALRDGTPVLRMYQYECVRRLIYRVEAFLPDGSRDLFVRVRIDNARDRDTLVYWWSNIAVDEKKGRRVVVPAKKAFHYGYGDNLRKVNIPVTPVGNPFSGEAPKDKDVSYPTNIPHSMDFFFDLPPSARPFIAALDENGYGLCQSSTRELRGRKLFVWGQCRGGRHWQQYLSRPGSAYIEIQAGLARTQLEHLPMKAGASIEWLESYGALDAGKHVHGDNWDKAVLCALNALNKKLPEERLSALHREVKTELDQKKGRVLHRAPGFALGDQALPGQIFHTRSLSLDAMDADEGEQMWIALAKTGVFPRPDPLKDPLGYRVGEEWESLLDEAVKAGRANHWHGHYHLGVMAQARGDIEKAEKEYALSNAQTPNPWALRGLSLISRKRGDLKSAALFIEQAAKMRPIRPLCVECMQTLLAAEEYGRVLSGYDALPVRLQKDGRLIACRAAAMLKTGKINEAEALLRRPFTISDVREGETWLSDLWFEACALRRFGRADKESVDQARADCTPPRHLDFRMR